MAAIALLMSTATSVTPPQGTDALPEGPPLSHAVQQPLQHTHADALLLLALPLPGECCRLCRHSICSESVGTSALIRCDVFCVAPCCAAPPELAQVGAAARRDAGGELACELCGKRLSRCKGRKYERAPGHICATCYDKGRKEKQQRTPEPSPIRRTPSAPLPPLTPLHHSHLRDITNQSGIGQQGRTRSAPENARALLLLDGVRKATTLSPDAAVKVVAAGEQMSPSRLRQVHHRFVREGELTPPPSKRISRHHPLHMLFGEGGPSPEMQAIIYERLKAAKAHNLYESSTTLGDAIHVKTGVRVPKSTLLYWLHDHGCRYGVKKITGCEESYSNGRIRRFIVDYAEALKKVREGTHILVWMDESYIHPGCTLSARWRR